MQPVPGGARRAVGISALLGGLAYGAYMLYTNDTEESIENEQDNDQATADWLRTLPKIELHAHLHGSVRPSTLAELYQRLPESERSTSRPQDQIDLIFKTSKSFEDVFAVFDIIHKTVTSCAILTRITREMIEDFATENVKYLELRTTPRALSESEDKRQYVQTVVNAIRDCENDPELDITVRLILSIHRSRTLEDAMDTLRIAKQFPSYIVGLDWSGKPSDTKFDYFVPVFVRAKELNLKTTIHYAEFFDREESDQILAFHPDRLGHAACLEQADWNVLRNEMIPVEICPTSNIITRCCETYEDHTFGRFLSFDPPYPMCICTDDRGVMSLDLTHEWTQLAGAFSLSRRQCKNLVRLSVGMTFLSSNDKFVLQKKINDLLDEI